MSADHASSEISQLARPERLESGKRRSRLLQLGVSLYLVAFLTAGLYTEFRSMQTSSAPLLEDFGYYRSALLRALGGQDPYAPLEIGTSFLYPPSALLLVELFNSIPDPVLRAAVYSAVNLSLLALVVHAVRRRFEVPIAFSWYWYPLCLGFAPFLELLHIGQINVYVVVALLPILLYESGQPVLAGAGLAAAAGIKLTPLVFFAYLAARKRFRVIAAALALLAFMSLLAAWRYGVVATLEYPSVVRWLSSQFVLDVNSQSLVAKLVALAEWSQRDPLIATTPQFLRVPVDWIAAALMTRYAVVQKALLMYVAVAIGASAWMTFRRGQAGESSFIITGLGMMLAPNIIWYHHYVFILLPLLIWMAASHLDVRIMAWCLFGFLVIQLDRWLPPYGLLIHVFGHVSIWAVLAGQILNSGPLLQVSRAATDAEGTERELIGVALP